MGLRFWKKNKLVDEFAQSVADHLFSHVSPEVAEQHVLGAAKAPKKDRVKTEQRLKDVVLQIKRFSNDNSLGIYGKARLQRTFDERLEELGYPSDVVKKISESILLRNA